MVFLDLPGANEFAVGVMALVAEHEAKMISDRTHLALQAYKRRGGKLGGQLPQCRNLTDRAAPRAVGLPARLSVREQGKPTPIYYRPCWNGGKP